MPKGNQGPSTPARATTVSFGVTSPVATTLSAQTTLSACPQKLFSIYPEYDIFDSTLQDQKTTMPQTTLDELKELILNQAASITKLEGQVNSLSATGRTSLTGPVTGTQGPPTKQELLARLKKRHDDLDNDIVSAEDTANLLGNEGKNLPPPAPVLFPPREERLKGEEVG